ncbi:putative CRISPR-associated protein [Calothrix sp. 336/3]|uniref:putative CRISPR-associated protein n=1 Tax=Calothrix sp. 336/3 TaxID=1337936 RepID=UPI0004E30EB6|nr:putative CRISPR-associated protein [Calothrix sp. 336/3]AKG20258.1 hypothetical protein IJ00_02075 [Calothrix sp. 336/3]
MSRLVISTVGTSLLTNEINERKDPKEWVKLLNKTANLSSAIITDDSNDSEYSEAYKIIQKLKDRAKAKLDDSNILEIREASAELNGIYALYDEKLENAKPDTHILIATDTLQGEVAAQLIESFLRNQGLNNIILWIEPELSLASSNIFTETIAKLIPKIEKTIQKGESKGKKVIFNLVGGFKALQGYFNTIGMFYADEVIYIFEGSNELVKIPKLPITINIKEVEIYKVPLAMMEQGEISTSDTEVEKIVKDIPEEWIVTDREEMILSTWGQLIWNQCKNELLSQDLLDFPRIDYKKQGNFLVDYQNIDKDDKMKKIKLQETIAQVAQKLTLSKGNTQILFSGGLDFNRYNNTSIDHFRINDSLRVSCQAIGNTLHLRYYGTHDHIYKKEGIKR